MFESIYKSAWHNPVFFVLANAIVLSALALSWRRRPPFVRAWALVFAIEIMLDATLTGEASPIARRPGLMQAAAISFVILGDWRWYLAVDRYARGAAPPRSSAKLLAESFAWSMLVPLASTGWIRLWPTVFRDSRRIFLSYEIAMLLLSVTWGSARLRRARHEAGPAIARWMRALIVFEVCTYALWVVADLVILSGRDAGYLVRLVPNTMYYAAFVPFVVWSAPREATA